MTSKLIIDTDPGIDDAMAILYAIENKNFHLEGLTTCYGNVSSNLTTLNALRLVELAQKNIPVYQGAHKPMFVPCIGSVEFIHGQDGLGNLNLPMPTRTVGRESASQFMISRVLDSPGEITIITLGPLTNLALALQLEPSLSKKVKKIIVMGGCIQEPGNVTPIAESNIARDPHAADIVFGADWDLTMIGLDVTHKVNFTLQHLHRIRENNPKYGEFIYNSNLLYFKSYEKLFSTKGEYIHVHDATAIAYADTPSLFTLERKCVRVAVDGIAAGATIMDRRGRENGEWGKRPKINVAMDVRADQVIENFMNYMG